MISKLFNVCLPHRRSPLRCTLRTLPFAPAPSHTTAHPTLRLSMDGARLLGCTGCHIFSFFASIAVEYVGFLATHPPDRPLQMNNQRKSHPSRLPRTPHCIPPPPPTTPTTHNLHDHDTPQFTLPSFLALFTFPFLPHVVIQCLMSCNDPTPSFQSNPNPMNSYGCCFFCLFCLFCFFRTPSCLHLRYCAVSVLVSLLSSLRISIFGLPMELLVLDNPSPLAPWPLGVKCETCEIRNRNRKSLNDPWMA